MILQRGLLLTACGLALGLLGTLAATKLVASLLYGVTATDPTTFASAGLLFAVAALAACLLPARRAMNVDPLVALRHE